MDFNIKIIKSAILIIVLSIFFTFVYEMLKCNHDYELEEKMRVVNEQNQQIRLRIIQRCNKCGDIKVNTINSF